MKIIRKIFPVFSAWDKAQDAQIDATKAKIYAQEALSNVDINTKWVEELEKKLKTLQLQYETLDNLLQEHLNKAEKEEDKDE